MAHSRSREGYVFREYLEAVVVAVLVALIVRTFIFAAYKIPTASMDPTLKVGDCLFAWKLPFGIRLPFSDVNLIKPQLPSRGEVIVFRYPKDRSISFVKRVVGMPGDKILIRRKRLFINDKLVKYEDARLEDSPFLGEVPVEADHIVQKEYIGKEAHFVLFHRNGDRDSYGPVVVPEGQLFVLGDNRDSSDDSRTWGMVPVENLEGRAMVIWCSFDWEHRFKGGLLPSLRRHRLFTLVH